MSLTGNILKEIDEAKKSQSTKIADPKEIKWLNNSAIAEMMGGKIEKALELFLEALEKSGNDQELQAQSLANIGDLVRRIKLGDPKLAREILDQARPLARTKVTESRIVNMIGMTFAPESTGDKSPEATDQHVKFLCLAIQLANEATEKGEDENEAFAAKVFAIRRLTASVIDWGDPKQKKSASDAIQSLLPLLPPDSDDWHKFRCSQAILISEEQPALAAGILTEAAKALHQSSPADSGPYFLLAAEYYLEAGDKTQAINCLANAKSLASSVKNFADDAEWQNRLERLEKNLETPG